MGYAEDEVQLGWISCMYGNNHDGNDVCVNNRWAEGRPISIRLYIDVSYRLVYMYCNARLQSCLLYIVE